MKIITTFISLSFLLFSPFHALVQTNIPGGAVSGIWSSANSPYLIQSSVIIPDGLTLSIEPGVQVIFQGSHQLFVQGRILALGTSTDTISFTAANTSVGWRGIRFDNTPISNDSSKFAYCKIEYAKNLAALSDGNGGGMYVNLFPKISLRNTLFKNCVTSCVSCNGNNGNGAGLFTNSPIVIKNCSFVNNQASTQGNGGGMYASGNNQVVSNCFFKGNVAFQYGGFYSAGINTLVNQCTFIDNGAQQNGGGLGLTGMNSSIMQSLIQSNSAGESGGGAYLMDEITIDDNTIDDNTAQKGGGIFAQGTITVTRNIITNNMSTGGIAGGMQMDVGGGGIFLYANGSELAHNYFSENTAQTFGGAIYSHGSIVTIQNNQLSGNSALTGGGAFFMRMNTGNTASITGNVMTNNSGVSGGAIMLNSNINGLKYHNNTISKNLATNGGALYAVGNNSVEFRNCIIHNNDATANGNQFYLSDQSSQPSFQNCNIEGGSADFFTNGNFYIGQYQNNISVNPLFVNPSLNPGAANYSALSDWRLQSGSPCIDAGQIISSLAVLDIDSNIRKSGAGMDMGAYEKSAACPGTLTPIFNVPNTVCSNTPSQPLPNLAINGIYGFWSPAVVNTTNPGPLTYTYTPLNGQCAQIVTRTIVVNQSPTAAINQTGPFAACQGNAPTLTSIVNNQGTYQWYNNGVAIPGAMNNSYIPAASGNITVGITQNGCLAISSPVAVTIHPLPATPLIAVSGSVSTCSGSTATLSAPSGYTSYLWTGGTTDSYLVASLPGNYSVQVTDVNNCQSSSIPYNVENNYEFPTQICIVGMDSLSGSNRIIWEKPLNERIDSFYVYKETIVANVYGKIGAKAYEDTALFIDVNSNPAVQAYRYKLSILDTCGNESLLSEPHKTIHLTINQGVGNTMNLIWNHYEGFGYGSYNIYRGTDSLSMDSLTTIQSSLNSFTDLNAPSGVVYYQIEVVNPNGCDPAKYNDYGVTRSNISNNGSAELPIFSDNSGALSVSPNPTDKDILLTIPEEWLGLSYLLQDGYGRVIFNERIESTKQLIDLNGLASGTYFLRIENLPNLAKITKQ
jgi:predicted outer membrane repeat protein